MNHPYAAWANPWHGPKLGHQRTTSRRTSTEVRHLRPSPVCPSCDPKSSEILRSPKASRCRFLPVESSHGTRAGKYAMFCQPHHMAQFAYHNGQYLWESVLNIFDSQFCITGAKSRSRSYPQVICSAAEDRASSPAEAPAGQTIHAWEFSQMDEFIVINHH